MPFLNYKILVREVSEQITKIQSQIIELEVEKTHMQGKMFTYPLGWACVGFNTVTIFVWTLLHDLH